MIKKLRLKFLLVFLMLVVSVFITSSCYAFTDIVSISDMESCPIDLEIVNGVLEDLGYTEAIGAKCVVYEEKGSSAYDYLHFYFFLDFPEGYYLQKTESGNTNNNQVMLRDTFGNIVSSKVACRHIIFKKKPTATNYDYTKDYDNYDSNFSYFRLTDTSIDISSATIYHSDILILNYDNSIFYDVSNNSIDSSFDYSLNGKSRGQVELKIDNLDSSLNMYGFVNIENSYSVGDTLNVNVNDSSLRLLSMYEDNSDLSCNLYEGEKLTYYIVDEDNIILDIGNINELAEGYFLYGFPVSDGVDFVFLNNGQVYWNNELTFKYQVDNGNLLTKNEVVSTGSYSYIESKKDIANIDYNGFVYNSSGEILSSATTSTSNDLSSFYIKEIDTHYFETKIGLNILIHDSSRYWLHSITLAGTDASGNDIDFSNYSVRWSIPTWLTVDSIEIGSSKYDKYNGVITGFTSFGYLNIDLKIEELLKNHSSDFDIKLEIYNNSGDLVLTHLVNSDDIVKNQILSEENNIDKPNYDITDNPNYTGGSGNKDFSNIQNWKEEDYLNLISTDNFVWEFFKAILGNLPWWISIPLAILIFGIVFITLFRALRGA